MGVTNFLIEFESCFIVWNSMHGMVNPTKKMMSRIVIGATRVVVMVFS